MSFQTAANLCHFGHYEKIRLAIPELLAGNYKAAAEILADAFIDVKEELDREQVAADISADEIQHILFEKDRQIEELRQQLKDTRAELAASEARAERYEELYEEGLADASLAKTFQQLATERIDRLEDQLAVKKEAEESDAEYVAYLQGEIAELVEKIDEVNEEPKKGKKPIWGGGVQLLYDEDDDDDATASVYPPLEFAFNGCLKGCEICGEEAPTTPPPSAAAPQCPPPVKRMPLLFPPGFPPLAQDEDILTPRKVDFTIAGFYADGHPYCPEKPLSFADVLTKTC